MKTIIQKWGVTIFILLLSIHLYAQILGADFKYLQWGSKFLLIPTLMTYLAAQNYFKSSNNGKWFVMLGLLGSFIGDVLLSFPNLFIIGMVAFMTTHIFNILFFIQFKPSPNSKNTKVYIYTTLLFCFCYLIYVTLKNAMGNLIYPVLVYMVLICSSAVTAVCTSRNENVKMIANLFWIPGMLFFITSDAVLAFNKFSWEKVGPHIKNIGLVTMMTYGIAQLLLVKGFDLYFKNNKS
ncbi:MAG: lysoplasmalogenase [Chitinophagia bacterium]|nr:lysoplasmalogenase [Chitinophagia bacterium]